MASKNERSLKEACLLIEGGVSLQLCVTPERRTPKRGKWRLPQKLLPTGGKLAASAAQHGPYRASAAPFGGLHHGLLLWPLVTGALGDERGD
jgi:hypothetical protein